MVRIGISVARQSLQKNKNHQHHQADRLEQGLHDFPRALGHRHCSVERQRHCHIAGKALGELGHPRLGQVSGGQRVGAGVLVQQQQGARRTIHVRLLVVAFGAELDPRDVLEPHQRAIRVGAQDDVAEFLGGQQAALRAHRVRKLLARRCRFTADGARGVHDILGRDRVDDIVHGQLELGQRVGRHPHSHRVIRGAKNLDLADAGDACEFVHDVDRGVVGKEGLVPGSMRRGDGENQQRKPDRLLRREAVIAHRGGQAGERLREPVLDLHLVEIDVRADLEVGLQGHGAVVAIDRLHVDHVLGAVDLLLDRSGHRLFHGERVGAGVNGRGLDLGRHDLGKLRDREPEDHHGAGNHKKNGDDHRHNGPVDEKFRHRR